MKVELADITQYAETKIEIYTRECYDSLNKMTEDSHKQFLPNIIKRGHLSALSFAYATFHISDVSRAFLAQMTRHAHLRYLVRSQRYNKEDSINFIMPSVFDIEDQSFFAECQQKIIAWYRKLNLKYKNEDSRMILSNAHKTSMNVTGNLQAWYSFLRLRLGKHAQLEIRNVAKEIYKILNKECPNIFTKELLEYQPKIDLDI